MLGSIDNKLKIVRMILVFLVANISPSASFRERMRIPVDTSKSTDTSISANKSNVTIVAILPYTSFALFKRGYIKYFEDSARNVNRNRYANFLFTNYYTLNTKLETMLLSASPLAVLETICDKVLPMNPSAIIYMTNSPVYGTNAASAQYMLQLTGYLGIPVIAWNVDNIGLEQVRFASFSFILFLVLSLRFARAKCTCIHI